MSSAEIIIMLTIIAYLVMMVVIGVVFSKKNSSVGDFYLADDNWDPLLQL